MDELPCRLVSQKSLAGRWILLLYWLCVGRPSRRVKEVDRRVCLESKVLMEIEQSLEQLGRDQTLSVDQTRGCIERMLEGEVDPGLMSRWLTEIRRVGESWEMLLGAAQAMRAHMVPVVSHRSGLLDTCGTGGDGSRTFNISTATALVVAACGVPVAKHGNRKITSSTGSADVLQALGIEVDLPAEAVGRCIDQSGIGFCFAPRLHPAMKQVSGVRRSLGFPTIFNALGPLCNPASAPFQLLGVGQRALAEKMAEALRHLPVERAIVVRGEDGLDEVSLMAPTEVWQITGRSIERLSWTPSDFGMTLVDPQSLFASDPDHSAQMIRQILEGREGPPRSIVEANAAAALWVAGAAESLRDGVMVARQAIESGRAGQLLSDLARQTQSLAGSTR